MDYNVYQFGPGTPVVGRWTQGTDAGHMNMGVLQSPGVWRVDSDGSFTWSWSDATYTFGLAGDIPVMGSWAAGSQYTATTIAEWENCIQNTQFSTCALAPGTYNVIGTIPISRSNVTVSGGSSNRTQTRLVRSPGNTDEIMKIDAAAALTGVRIENLTFCGSSTLSAPSICPTPVPTTCRTLQLAGTKTCVDLDIAHAAAPGVQPDDPFSYTGPYGVTISNAAFEGSTGHAISIHPTAPKKVNDVYITGTAVNSYEVTGILVGVNGEDYRDPRACDSMGENFKNDTSLHVPRNIRVEGGNTFQNNLTGALGINAARWFKLRDNTFTNNYFNPQGGNSNGGTIFFDHCTDKVRIYKNDFTGPTYDFTSGLELWGRNIDVGSGTDPAERNTVSNYRSEGIGLHSAFNVSVKNNATSNNGAASETGGIVVMTREPGGPCAPVQRDTKQVTISGNTSTSEYFGLVLDERQGGSPNIIDTIAVSNNTGTAEVDAYVTLTGQVSGLPAPTAPLPEQFPPRALAVNPMKDLVGTPRPAPLKCSSPGRSREVFTFPASDVDVDSGAGNIYWFQGIFSIAGNDVTGEGGPDNGAQGCHFIFYPPENASSCTPSSGCGALHLDGDQGGSNWIIPPSPSVVGPGGIDLASSYCKIRAGSADSKVDFSGKVLKLTRDIEFFFSSIRHFYTITRNRDDVPSDGGAWRYWGWWSPANP